MTDGAGAFSIVTPERELEFIGTGATASFLLDNGFANADREPHWHLRWCLDRMEVGEAMDVGSARVVREAPYD
ncbi:hypothetical protein Bra3105_08825 [Brachybacterium halotolerans subsp. kimchii]|uniref:hypothetical protein n=1 Tax=Brachybacterium halotolerans TaxID=2795215 RepID=UPI001E369F5B|nr:hypothetical protein [Brachybacterium halotolerans]UEJ84389.1 hypothetical protein Bra3105_08825 [Brachybacterium halotolerans subsp. kimchii]